MVGAIPAARVGGRWSPTALLGALGIFLVGAATADGALVRPLGEQAWRLGVLNVVVTGYFLFALPHVWRLHDEAVAALRRLAGREAAFDAALGRARRRDRRWGRAAFAVGALFGATSHAVGDFHWLAVYRGLSDALMWGMVHLALYRTVADAVTLARLERLLLTGHGS